MKGVIKMGDIKVKDCRFCRHFKFNEDYDYMTNDKVPLCFCTIESEFWEGELDAMMGGPIECDDYENEE